jgi:hypothetical protein
MAYVILFNIMVSIWLMWQKMSRHPDIRRQGPGGFKPVSTGMGNERNHAPRGVLILSLAAAGSRDAAHAPAARAS